jgi:hypothetical protein
VIAEQKSFAIFSISQNTFSQFAVGERTFRERRKGATHVVNDTRGDAAGTSNRDTSVVVLKFAESSAAGALANFRTKTTLDS